MQLQPKHPPGRKRHKVRAYAAEIHRLHADGYTCDEIREALADVGVVVSRSTVQREAARTAHRPALANGTVAAVVPPPSAATPADVDLTPPSLQPGEVRGTYDPRNARQVAEDFMKGQVTNPLLRTERKS